MGGCGKRANGLLDRLPIKPGGAELAAANAVARKAIEIAVAAIEWENGED